MSDLFSGFSSFTKSVNDALNSYEMRKIGDKVQSFVLNFTEVELKVREATNEDPWGPTGPQMQELAQLTYQYDAFPEIMGMLWKRMFQDNKLAWRRVYKSLILLNNLLKTGSERVINNAKDHLFEMRALESYNCVDERGRDQGVNIRHRVKQIIELLQDDELLMHERQKTKTENKEKYQGYSKEDMLYKGKVSSFESWNENKFRNSKSNDFDFPETRRDKEVSSYDFDQNRSASPELGIPDNSYHRHKNQPENNDDDEFGDFADARSSTNNQQHTTNNTSNDNDLFGGFSSPTNNASNNRLPKPPSVPTSPVPKNNSQPAQANVGNLFDLDFNDSQSAAPTSNHSNGNNGLDLFGGSTIAPAAQNNVDIFGDFSAPTPAAAQTVQNTRPSNDLDNIFGDFDSSSAPVVNSNTPSGWGELIMPTPVQQQQSNPTVQEKTAEPKMGDGWSFLEAQLDGLTGGNKQKAAPSMNELRTKKI